MLWSAGPAKRRQSRLAGLAGKRSCGTPHEAQPAARRRGALHVILLKYACASTPLKLGCCWVSMPGGCSCSWRRGALPVRSHPLEAATACTTVEPTWQRPHPQRGRDQTPPPVTTRGHGRGPHAPMSPLAPLAASMYWIGALLVPPCPTARRRAAEAGGGGGGRCWSRSL